MSSEQVRTLRSDFLIHWTGKGIQKHYKRLNDAERKQYTVRLRDILSEGLWMTENTERVRGYKGSFIEYGGLPMTCFTEIRLSAVHRHTQRYGCLGVGVSRRFVIERCGGPVQYVSGTEDDAVIGNIAASWEALQYLKEANIRLHFSDIDFGKTMEGLRINIGFIKNMSDPNHPRFPHDFTFLDEAEWRILYVNRKEAEGKLIETGIYRPKAKIPVKPSDLKVLIFPDSKTRKMAFEDSDIRKWFADPPDFLVIATVEECLHF